MVVHVMSLEDKLSKMSKWDPDKQPPNNHNFNPHPQPRTGKRSVSYAMQPLQHLLSLIAMNKFTYDGEGVRELSTSTKMYMAACAGAVAFYGVYAQIYTFQSNAPSIILVLSMMGRIAAMLTAVGAVLKTAYFNTDKALVMVANLDEIDAKLKTNDPSGYDIARRKIWLFNCVYLLIVTTNLALDELYTNEWWDVKALILEHILNVMVTAHMYDFSVVLWLNIARCRAANDDLKSILDNFDSKVEERDVPLGKDTVSMEYFFRDFKNVKVVNAKAIAAGGIDLKTSTRNSERIHFSLKIFDMLADNIQIINDCYGLPLLFSSTAAFLSILMTINGLIMENTLFSTPHFYNKLLIVFWCVPFTLCLLIATYVSELLKDEIEKATLIIDKLTINRNTDSDQLQLLECFSQLITGRHMFISAYNFFSYDFSFVFSLIGTIATYTVILMQANTGTTTAPANPTNDTVTNSTA